ncbi:hypothetical protein TorRG33x02_351810, partial [Trema orientale]
MTPSEIKHCSWSWEVSYDSLLPNKFGDHYQKKKKEKKNKFGDGGTFKLNWPKSKLFLRALSSQTPLEEIHNQTQVLGTNIVCWRRQLISKLQLRDIVFIWHYPRI